MHIKRNPTFRRRCSAVGHFIVVLQLTVCFVCIETAASVKPPGETTPDIEMNIGSSGKITCRITEGNSSEIWFSEEETGRRIIQQNKDIHILDDLTAELTIRNASEQMGRYQCMVGENAIGVTKVYVGTPPTDVKDFSCKCYDLDYMTCTFSKPQNMINTNYELYLKANLDKYSDRCALQITDDITYTYNLTSPIVISREIYHFNLTGTNSLGSRSQFFTINKEESVVPAKLEIEITKVTSSSVSLFWQVPKFAFYVKYGLEYEIIIEPTGFPPYHVNDYNSCYSASCSVTINNLKYPNRNYTVSVRTRLRPAKIHDEMWSKPYIGSFTTQPRHPDNPPKTAIGSFYIDSIETHLRLYWQQLAEYEENGPGFYYLIYEMDMEGNVINTKNSTETSVTFAWKNDNRYNYEIRACNSFGQSDRSSQIRVRPIRETEFAHAIATVYHNRTYTLSWKPPINQRQLVNYTVFWCLSKMESPNQCRGSIHFKYLDKQVTNFTTEPQDHTLNLAISANFINAYSGMQWARCSADISSDLMKLEPEEKTITATTISVKWSSESICPSILQGYNLSYCQVPMEASLNIDQSNINCSTSKITVVILRGQMNDKEYTIRGLKPFTKYHIEMLMFSETKVGPISDALYVITSESAPSVPRNLQFNATSITSKSVTIFWQRPIHTNGILKYYTVWKIKNNTTEHKDQQKFFINETIHGTNDIISFEMESLNSYANYEVYVTAHTSQQSEKSNSIYFKTLIGIPSNPRNVSISDEGDYGVLQWDIPQMPSGRIEYYEVALVALEQEKIFLVKEPICKFKFPSCTDYYMKVRAVNVAKNHEIDHHTFPNTKGRNLRYRRSPHSNSEISATVYDTIFSTSNPTSSVNHQNVNRRSDVWNTTVETTPYPIKANSDNIVVDSLIESDFKCLDVKPIDVKYFGPSQDFTTLPSIWERTPNMFMRCSEYPLTNVVKIALFMLLLSSFLGSISYWLRKKYNKMKNIEAVLPEELTDHMPNYHIGYGNKEKDMHFDLSRSNDCLVYPKESYHVLTTICKGSTKGISSLTQANVDGLVDVEIKNQTSTPPSSIVCCNEEKFSTTTDSLEINDNLALSDNVTTAKPESANSAITKVPEKPLNLSSGYINPVNFVPTQFLDPAPVETFGNNVNLPLSINGYVQPNALNLMSTQPPSSNGYTTLDAMGKPVFPSAGVLSTQPVSPTPSKIVREPTNESVQRNIKEPDVENIPNGLPSHNVNNNNNNNNNNNLICGYVTQRQLAEFGQLLH